MHICRHRGEPHIGFLTAGSRHCSQSPEELPFECRPKDQEELQGLPRRSVGDDPREGLLTPLPRYLPPDTRPHRPLRYPEKNIKSDKE